MGTESEVLLADLSAQYATTQLPERVGVTAGAVWVERVVDSEATFQDSTGAAALPR